MNIMDRKDLVLSALMICMVSGLLYQARVMQKEQNEIKKKNIVRIK